MSELYADIIVDISHEKLDKIFQYAVPSRLEGALRRAVRWRFLLEKEIRRPGDM